MKAACTERFLSKIGLVEVNGAGQYTYFSVFIAFAYDDFQYIESLHSDS